LHPRHKLTYFQRAGWTPEWIAAAKRIVRDEYDRSYRFRDEVLEAEGPEPTTDTSTTTKNLFDTLPAFRSLTFGPGTVDELSRYMSTPPEDVKNEELLMWWTNHKREYPHVARMALDYHTIPSKYLQYIHFCLIY